MKTISICLYHCYHLLVGGRERDGGVTLHSRWYVYIVLAGITTCLCKYVSTSYMFQNSHTWYRQLYDKIQI